MQLARQTLAGRFVRLEPLAKEHKEPLRRACAADAEIWDIYPWSMLGEHFDTWWSKILAAGSGWNLFAVILSGSVVGVTGYPPEPGAGIVLVGGTYFRPEARGGPTNPESKRLLLEHAFGAGARRVVFNVDPVNGRSRAAMNKIGAVEEGIARQASVTWTGRTRDLVVFSILAHEWPGVRTRLDERIATFGLRRSPGVGGRVRAASGTRLSVNLNKIALLRNSRETGVPSVVDIAGVAISAGADGITVHPRPDGRHIRPIDVIALGELIAGIPARELNIEGRPSEAFLSLVERVRPAQCTLVPDGPDALTSDRGRNFQAEHAALTPIVGRLSALGCRVMLFSDPSPLGLQWASATGAHGIEIYTGTFAAAARSGDFQAALRDVALTSTRASELGLTVNGGHDLNRRNLGPLLTACDFAELSIGHELIADALVEGFSTSVRAYRTCLSALRLRDPRRSSK